MGRGVGYRDLHVIPSLHNMVDTSAFSDKLRSLPRAASLSFRGVIDTSSVLSEKLARLPGFLLSRMASSSPGLSPTGSIVPLDDLPIGGRLARLKARSTPRLVYSPDHRHNKPILSSSPSYVAPLNRSRKAGRDAQSGKKKKKKNKDPYKAAREKVRLDREFLERDIILKATLAFPPFPLTRVTPPPQTVLPGGGGEGNDDDGDLEIEYYGQDILDDFMDPQARPLPRDAFAVPYCPPADPWQRPKRGKELWGAFASPFTSRSC